MSRVLVESDFLRMLGWELQRAARYQDFLALCLIRIEPPVEAGPEIREAVGERIADLLRVGDVVGTMDTDIAVLLLYAPAADAAAIADRIRERTESSPFSVPSTTDARHVSVSTAVAAFPSDATTEAALLNHARTRLGIVSRRDVHPA
jgi:GGDEF domain-containing protein